MNNDSEHPGPQPSWRESAETLLEKIPGVVSARVQGAREAVSEVRVWYEPTWPVGQVIDAVHRCLSHEVEAHVGAAKFHAVVALPDRRAQPRVRPHRPSWAAAGWGSSPYAPLRLVGHSVEEVREGVVGVEVWIEWEGRTFNGAALGPTDPPGSIRTPALATLRALHSCLQILYEGPRQPGLVLESAIQTTVEGAPVAVVALTASENARPRPLTAAWADQGSTALAFILATLHATSRTVTRWLGHGERSEDLGHASADEGHAALGAAVERRFTLVDFEVDHAPSGDLDIGVRLAGFGQAVDRRRAGSDDEASHLRLGASATLDAVHDLLRIGGWNERHDGDLRSAGACRLRTGEHDLVVVLAEALMHGHRIPLAGAISADCGVERASITATLQATNALVADRTALFLPVAALAHA